MVLVGLLPSLCCAQQLSDKSQPLTLNQTIREAVENNLELIAQRFNVPIAQAQVITASLRPNPVLSLSYEYLYFTPASTTGDIFSNPTEYSARTDFIFERGGKRQRRMDVAYAARSVAELQVIDAVRLTVLNVQKAFVEVLHAKADLTLAQETLATFDEVVRINTSRVRNGDLAEVELIRSEVARLQSENTVRKAELELQTARARLQILLGRRREDPMVDATGEMRAEQLSVSLETLVEQAIAQRPDLLAQRKERIRSQADIRLQLANAKVDYTFGSEYNKQKVSGRSNSVAFYFFSALPVFNRNQGEIERARQQEVRSEAQTRAVEATIQNEVEIAYLTYNNSLVTVTRIEQSLVAKAKDVRQVAEFSYKRGQASFLELLDAQRAYNETMLAYNGARADLAQSLYTVDAAVGAPVTMER